MIYPFFLFAIENYWNKCKILPKLTVNEVSNNVCRIMNAGLSFNPQNKVFFRFLITVRVRLTKNSKYAKTILAVGIYKMHYKSE